VAYSLNFTVVPPARLAFLTAWPTGNPPSPAVSILNDLQGTVIANFAVVPGGTSGSIDIFVTDQTHVIVDINGYYAAPSSLSITGNLTVGGQILGNGGPIISAPNDSSSNFSAGLGAMPSVTSGTRNTAIGDSALHANTTGDFNTAIGYQSLFNNVNGTANDAFGSYTLFNSTAGSANVAIGENTMYSNTSGGGNTAVGHAALVNNTIASQNTAIGYQAMYYNTGGTNAALGYNALLNNATGNNNTAIGAGSLLNSTGSNNVAFGSQAGSNILSGSNNIDISSLGSSSDSGVVRVGTPGTQTKIFISGIRSVTTGNNDAVPVVIDSNGQLGTASSSKRFKEDISDMDAASDGLFRLRPVTFRYSRPYADGSKPIDYGLIAEEVAEVYPDLVVKGPDGQVETVQYQKLTPMLLNEVQKQNQQIRKLTEANRSLEARLAALEELLARSSGDGQHSASSNASTFSERHNR
jgi:hypothetical protein